MWSRTKSDVVRSEVGGPNVDDLHQLHPLIYDDYVLGICSAPRVLKSLLRPWTRSSAIEELRMKSIISFLHPFLPSPCA